MLLLRSVQTVRELIMQLPAVLWITFTDPVTHLSSIFSNIF